MRARKKFLPRSAGLVNPEVLEKGAYGRKPRSSMGKKRFRKGNMKKLVSAYMTEYRLQDMIEACLLKMKKRLTVGPKGTRC